MWVPVLAVTAGADDQTLELPQVQRSVQSIDLHTYTLLLLLTHPLLDSVFHHAQAAYAAAIATAQQALGDERSDAVSSKLSPRLLVAPSSVHSAQLEFQLECCAPPLLLRFALIRSLPLLMTPLAASLSRQEFGTGPAVRRSGYLTLDRARKAVPVLRTDPLVLQRPIVGVWVYGVPLSDEWSDATAQAQMADPYVYFACLTYVASQTIRERVELSANTFLVAIYPSGHASSLPRFFECSFSELVDRTRGAPLPLELYAQRQSCLVGVASFASDVDFALSSLPSGAWELAKTERGIPTAPSTAREHSDENTAPRVSDTNEQVLAALERSTDTWEAAHVRRPFAASAGPTMRRADGDDKSVNQRQQRADSIDASESRAASSRSFEGTDSRRSFARVTFESPRSVNKLSDMSLPRDESESENAHPNTARPIESVVSDRKPHQRASSLPAAALLSPRHLDDHADETPSSPSAADVTSPVRSCCKTQALLTIQHQQILENQQRQLHEMQEQIAHLRQLLRASKALDSASIDADGSASRASDARDVSARAFDETERGNNNSQSDSEDSDAHEQRVGADESVDDRLHLSSAYAEEALAPETSNTDPNDEAQWGGEDDSENNSVDDAAAPSAMPHAHGDDDGKAQDERAECELASDNESSLHLSSLSNTSMRSDLSSLSSSLVGAQLKATFRASTGRKNDALSASRRSVASSRSSRSSTGREAREQSGEVGSAASARNRKSFGLDSEREVDDSDDDDSDDDLPVARSAPFEKMLTPDSYLKRHGALMDRHGGSCYTTAPATLDLHSFCVPRIKFAPARSPRGFDASLSDSDDEEFRLIEQKYKRLLAS